MRFQLCQTLIAELSLRTKWHATWHMISARCVARDLHTVAPGPLERTCWRRFAALWGDCKNSRIAPLNAIIIIIIIIIAYLRTAINSFLTITGKSPSWQELFSTLVVHANVIPNLQKRCKPHWDRYQRKTLRRWRFSKLAKQQKLADQSIWYMEGNLAEIYLVRRVLRTNLSRGSQQASPRKQTSGWQIQWSARHFASPHWPSG